MTLPLESLRIIEVTDDRADMCGRLLADLGAEVVRVRHSTGVARPPSPTPEGIDLRFELQNANKEIIDVDLEGDGRATLRRLLAVADVFIESLHPSRAAALGLDATTLLAANPRLVVTSVSDFGQDGPYRDWPSTEWVHMAMNSVLSRSGLTGQPPLMPPGSMAEQTAAFQAAWATLVAYWHASATGAGQHVDLSILEASLQTMDSAFGMGGSATGAMTPSDLPAGRPDTRYMYPIFPCADGHVRICVLSKRQWRGMFTWLGEPAQFADPKYDQMYVRFAAADELHPLIGALFAPQTRAEIVTRGQEFGIPTESVQSGSEVLATPHFLERGAFRGIELAPSLRAIVPDGCIELDGERLGLRHTARSSDVATIEQRWSEQRQLATSEPLAPFAEGPLLGLRVLDLGVIVAGAEAGRLFADMGADVIKVENRAFPDGSRQTRTDGMTPSFAWGHRNKRSFGVNLRSDEGKAIFLRMVAQSDVVLSNFKPGTLQSLGLGFDVLAATNPGIVAVDSSSLGNSGPWSGRMGYGPLVRAVTGLTQAWRYPDEPEGFCDAITIYPDHTSARVAACAALACLLRRRESLHGGRVSIAQAEVMFTQFAVEFARESIEPGTFIARGNVGELDAPYGVYPCAGDDQWCAVTIRNDDDWQRLCRVLGVVELAVDPSLATSRGRVQQRSRVDEAVTQWTTQHPPREAMRQLMEHGIPAGAMNRVGDLLDDPQLVARDFFRTLRQPTVGDFPTESAAAVFAGNREVPLRPAPQQAEHTIEIAKELFDFSDEEVADLLERGILEVSS